MKNTITTVEFNQDGEALGPYTVVFRKRFPASESYALPERMAKLGVGQRVKMDEAPAFLTSIVDSWDRRDGSDPHDASTYELMDIFELSMILSGAVQYITERMGAIADEFPKSEQQPSP